MSYNTKNYTVQGGEKTVIGGTLEIKEGASVTGLPSAPNQAASTATNVAGLKDDLNALLSYESLNPAQGTHKWVAILITTGLPAITAVKYNGSQLTSADVAEAAAVGGQAGDIVMWLKCDEIVNQPKSFTLWASGYPEATFTVVIAEPETEE